MDKVKVGVVGLGWAASGHLPAFARNPNCVVDALCTSKDLSAEEVRALTGGPEATVYHDYDEFLAHPGLDVVDICTPHSVHAPQAIAAARAGKHLMIEKPLAVTWEDLLAMKEAIEAAGVLSTVYFELRFIPHFQLVHSVTEKGLLGDIHYFEVDYYHAIGPWYGQWEWNVKKDMGGSSLITAGVHALDALLDFANRPVQQVSAYSIKSSAAWAQPYEYDTTSVSLLRFEDGAIGKCTSSVDCRQPYVFNVHLVGSEGTLWNDEMWTTQIDGLEPEEWMKLPTTRAESGDVLDHPYPPQVDHFIECVRTGKDSFINFAEAFNTHRVMFAIEKSLAEGRPVDLSEMEA